MTRRARIALDVLLALFGLGLFVYADITTSRALRLAGVLLLVIAIVVALILSVRRDDSST